MGTGTWGTHPGQQATVRASQVTRSSTGEPVRTQGKRRQRTLSAAVVASGERRRHQHPDQHLQTPTTRSPRRTPVTVAAAATRTPPPTPTTPPRVVTAPPAPTNLHRWHDQQDLQHRHRHQGPELRRPEQPDRGRADHPPTRSPATPTAQRHPPALTSGASTAPKVEYLTDDGHGSITPGVISRPPPAGLRSYFGGCASPSRRATVFRLIDSFSAIAALLMPSTWCSR